MMEFFKLIGKNSAEIESQKGARMRQLQASNKAGRPPGRPVCTNVHRARSTARSTVAGEQSTARSTDWYNRSLSWTRLTDRLTKYLGPVDRQANLGAICISF